MEATFPMQTTAKCRLQKGSARYLNEVEKGMSVYLYDKSITDESDETMASVKDSAGEVKTVGGVEFIYIPGATYNMGVNTVRDENYYLGENVKHSVTVSSYWIGKFEVTQAQYRAVTGKNPSPVIGDNLPVENISWYDAKDFCEKFSKKYNVKARLPYEAEWEYAARGGATTIYYWGDDIDDSYCWYSNNSGRTSHPVGQKKPNAFGLYDMSGNVCEWVNDWYNESYYSESPDKDPQGPSSGEKKIMRGGSYINMPMHPSPMRIDIRMTDTPDIPSEGWGAFGLRLVIEQ